MTFNHILIVLLFLLSIFASCENSANIGEAAIAEVFGTKLLEAEIERTLGAESTNEGYRAQFIDSWIKKQLLLEEAKKDKQSKKEVNQLVNEYRESLLIQKHKDRYVRKKLNVNVSKEEMKEAYDQLKEDYKIQQAIFKLELLITPADHFDKLDLNNYFRKKDYEEWKNSLANLVDLHLQDTSKWYTWGEIEQFLPPELMSSDDLQSNKDYNFEDENHLFFIRIFDLIDENEIAPLSYMEDKLKNAILERKKEALLNEYNAALYKSALQNNKIKQN